MKIRELLNIWQRESSQPQESSEHRVKLTVHDAAKLAALAELFPARSEQQLLSELIGSALDELQAIFPYVQSTRIQTWDEEGDPIYADAGFGPSFHELSLKHLKRAQEAARRAALEPAGSAAGRPPTPQQREDRQALERAENEGMTGAQKLPPNDELH